MPRKIKEKKILSKEEELLQSEQYQITTRRLWLVALIAQAIFLELSIVQSQLSPSSTDNIKILVVLSTIAANSAVIKRVEIGIEHTRNNLRSHRQQDQLRNAKLFYDLHENSFTPDNSQSHGAKKVQRGRH